MNRPEKARKQIQRIKTRFSIDSDSELARRIGTRRQQINQIKNQGFPTYVSGLIDLLLPMDQEEKKND